MNPITFTTEQYNQMSRPQKATLLIDCISLIHNNILVTVDNNPINTMPSFVSWLLDNQ